MKFIDEVKLAGEKVFVRVDFNVPCDEKGNITDDRRIKATVPTIKYLLDEGCSLVLASHMGRPKGKRVEGLSLKPAARRLSEIIGREVNFLDDCIGEKVKEEVRKMKTGDVILLENLRFHEGETKNDTDFAKELAELGEVYVNDAFAASHRKHASVHAVANFFDVKLGGLLVKKEIEVLKRLLESPSSPFVAILGGAKVSDKVGTVKNLVDKVNKLIIGGAMAFTFIEALGIKTGRSLVEEELIDTAGEILEAAKNKKVKVYLPVDCVVAKSPEDEKVDVTPVQEIPDELMGLDIGPATIMLFCEALKDASTVVWNGPMGVFEREKFSKGTYAIASYLANLPAFAVIGGGDTDAAVHKAGESHKFSYISTGGGAFLEFLEGKSLPGIEAIS